MRRLLIISFFLLMASVCNAQSRYVVYKCTEGVSVRKFRDDRWISANKHDEVSLVDFLKIDEDGSLVILDNRNRSLYKFGTTGEKSLKSLIDEAVRKADKVTANLNRELVSNMGTGDGNMASYSHVAAAYRGSDNGSSVDSLGVFVRNDISFTEGDAVVCRFYGHPELEEGLTCVPVAASEDEVCFRFGNATGCDLFVNVVCVGRDGSRNLCYDFGYSSESPFIFLPDGAEVSLPQYSFAMADGGFSYVMLATTQIYDYHELQMLCSSTAK